LESSAKQTKKLFETMPGVPLARPAMWLSRYWQLFIILLMAGDIAMIGLAFRLAFILRFEVKIGLFRLDITPSLPFYQNVGTALILVWLAVFTLTGLYNRRNLLGGTQEYALVFRATNTGMLLVIVAGFLQPDFILARGWLLLAWLLSFLFVCTVRLLLRRLVYYLRRHGYFLTPTLIIGMNQEGQSLAQQLLGWHTSGLSVMGFVDNGSSQYSPSNRLPHLGSLAQIDQLVERYDIKELVIVTSALTREAITAIFERYGISRSLGSFSTAILPAPECEAGPHCARS
jgi:FlaA1/EpsC-like NDP-sugar epimerase